MNGSFVLAGAVLPALFLSGAEAAIVLADNFDSYADQTAFLAAWPAQVGSGGTLSTATFTSAPNAVSFPLTAQRNGRLFPEAGVPSSLNVVAFSFDFHDSDSTAAPYRQSASLIDGAGTASGQLISLGLNNNLLASAQGGNFYMARILGYTPPGQAAGDFFKLNDNPALLRSTGWHRLGVEVSDTEFRFYVDGSLAKTVANSVTLRSYDLVRLGSGLSSTNGIFIDNVLVETNPIPEPRFAALALLGGAATCLRRLRRKT